MRNLTNYIFLHGGGQGGWVWSETIAALQLQAGASAIRTLALDAPGCGLKRGRDTSKLQMNDVLAELLSDIVATGMRDIVLIGHSQAGTVMPWLVELRPELFRRLVYATCSVPLPGQTILQMMGSGLHDSHPDEVGWPFDPKLGNRRDRYPEIFCNDMTLTDAAALLAKIGADSWPLGVYSESQWRYGLPEKVPATYVVCLQDRVLPVLWQEKFASRLKAQRLVRIDSGHQVMNSRPHSLAEILRIEATQT